MIMKLKKKQLFAAFLSLALVIGLMPGMSMKAYAGDYAHFQPEVGDVTLHDDNSSVASITVKWQWPYGTGSNAVVVTKAPIYRGSSEYVSYYGSSSYSYEDSLKNIDWETAGNKDSTMSNVLDKMDFVSVNGSDSSPYKGSYTFEFTKGQVPKDTDNRLYFYLWTTTGGKYYPDFQLAMLDMKDKKVYYGQEETLDSNGNVIWTQVKFATRFKAAENLVYSGNAQNLVTPSPATADGVTVKYAITGTDVTTAPSDDSELWKDSSAQTNAGTYRVWYKTIVTEAADYKASSGAYLDVTISQADNPATVTGTANVMVGGNNVDLKNNVSLNEATGVVSYEISGETNGCSLNGSVLTSGSDMGTVTVNVTVAQDTNYKALAATPITVTITDKETAVPATVKANDRTYDGTAKPLVTVDNSTLNGGTMQYVIGKDAKNAPEPGWSTAIPQATDAGTYYVWYKAVGDSTHWDSAEACVKVVISEAASTPADDNTDKKETNSVVTTAPKTGDADNAGIWYFLLFVSVGGLGCISFLRKRVLKNEQ